ncbi:MAG: hypothetical protein ACREJC_05820 [Tepidisphaeraceae bacterium]
MNCRFQVALILGLFELVCAGCGSSGAPKPAQQTTAPVSASEPTGQDAVEPNPSAPGSPEQAYSAPDALARRADAYAKEMEAALSARPDDRSKSSKLPPTVASPKPSDVQWIDPADKPAREEPTQIVATPPSAVQTSPAQTLVPPKPPPDASTAGAIIPHQPDPSPPLSQPTSSLDQKLHKRVSEYPRDVSGHLDYQLLHFLLDEQVPLLTSLAALPGEDRELVAAVIDGLSNFRSNLRSDNNMLLSKKVRPLLEMSDRLRSQAELSIGTIALCNSVKTFGIYEPIDPPRFVAGKNIDVILYCEVDNFSSQLNDQQIWETKLTQETVLYSENGQPVWSDRSETLVDQSRSRRHDFFVNKVLRLPSTLGIGRFLLKVSIVDQYASRVAERTVPVVIVAQ